MVKHISIRIHIPILFILFFIIFFFSFTINTRNSFAATVTKGNCNTNKLKSINDSIYDACRAIKDNSGGVYGVMWLSSNNNTEDITTVVTVRDWQKGDGRVPIYLHGAILNGGSALASHIYLIVPPKGLQPVNCNGIITKICENPHNFEAYPAFVNKSGNILKDFWMVRTGNPNPWSENITSSTFTLYLNVKKMMKQEDSANGRGHTEEVDPSSNETYWVYKLPIESFRCYGQKNYGPSCYSSSSTLQVRVLVSKPPEEPEPSTCPIASTPSSYTNSNSHDATTSTISRVFNTSTNSGWQQTVYAKPDDQINWGHCYFPGIQRTANTLVTVSPKPDSHPTNSDNTTFPNRNERLATAVGLTNQYTVTGTNINFSFTSSDLTVGNDTIQSNQNYSNIIPNDVSKTISESSFSSPARAVITNQGDHTWECKAGTCSHGNDYISYSVTGQANDTASVIVPYNFENTIILNPIDNKDKSTFAYAGESYIISSTISTNPRFNPVTGGTYATRVDAGKKKAELCVGTTCYETNPLPINLNSDGNTLGSIIENDAITFNIPDLPAGTEICLRTAVYPIDSHDDYNTNPTAYPENDNNSWSWSNKRCLRVAKRPSLQVVGGNIYSAGAIVADYGTKNLVYGHYSEESKNLIDPTNASVGGPFVFGSWGELGLISTGSVRGFASGATLGYATNNSPNPTANSDHTIAPGGGNTNDFCSLSVLTIPSSGCENKVTNKSNVSSVTSIDSIALTNLATSNDIINNTGITLTNNEVTGGELFPNSFGIISSDRDIFITGNIFISNDITFNNFRQIPRLIIYSQQNIIIDCAVTRLDAVIVAKGQVSTCSPDILNEESLNSNDNPYDNTQNDPRYSNQLIVNGAIIAENLIANRTYGASYGANSIVPAELINFDPTLYLWNITKAEGTNTPALNGDFHTTYIEELPPRY